MIRFFVSVCLCCAWGSFEPKKATDIEHRKCVLLHSSFYFFRVRFFYSIYVLPALSFVLYLELDSLVISPHPPSPGIEKKMMMRRPVLMFPVVGLLLFDLVAVAAAVGVRSPRLDVAVSVSLSLPVSRSGGSYHTSLWGCSLSSCSPSPHPLAAS